MSELQARVSGLQYILQSPTDYGFQILCEDLFFDVTCGFKDRSKDSPGMVASIQFESEVDAGTVVPRSLLNEFKAQHPGNYSLTSYLDGGVVLSTGLPSTTTMSERTIKSLIDTQFSLIKDLLKVLPAKSKVIRRGNSPKPIPADPAYIVRSLGERDCSYLSKQCKWNYTKSAGRSGAGWLVFATIDGVPLNFQEDFKSKSTDTSFCLGAYGFVAKSQVERLRRQFGSLSPEAFSVGDDGMVSVRFTVDVSMGKSLGAIASECRKAAQWVKDLHLSDRRIND